MNVFYTWPRFEKEAKSNSEMGYCHEQYYYRPSSLIELSWLIREGAGGERLLEHYDTEKYNSGHVLWFSRTDLA